MIRQIAPLLETVPAQIVLVDHEQSFVEKTTNELTAEGFTCRGFTSIETAAAAVRFQRPDLLLIAINVPGVNGSETIHRVRANPHLANLPVIFLSACADSRHYPPLRGRSWKLLRPQGAGPGRAGGVD